MNFPTVSRGQADKGFTVVYNNEGGELIPGVVCEFDLTATTAEQGYYVEKVDIVVNATTGIAAPLAGVVTNTIATASVGRLQVYGPCAVTVTGTVVAGSQRPPRMLHTPQPHWAYPSRRFLLTSPSFSSRSCNPLGGHWP